MVALFAESIPGTPGAQSCWGAMVEATAAAKDDDGDGGVVIYEARAVFT